MFFNEEVIEKLNKCLGNKEKITICGVNALGKNFESTGRIAESYNNLAGFGNLRNYAKEPEESYIMLDFGEVKSGENYSDFLAPFKTCVNDKFFLDGNLYIINIKDSIGNLIYTNDEITIEKIDKMVATYKETGIEKCRVIDRDDLVTTELRKMIGQPIILNERKGVLTCVRGANNYGGTLLTIRDATLQGSVSVDEDSVLKDMHGNVLAKNNIVETLDIFSERVQKIANAKDKDRITSL